MRGLFVTIGVLATLAVVTWYFAFYENVVNAGVAYGLEIGTDKEMVVSILISQYEGSDIDIMLSPNARGNDISEIQHLRISELPHAKLSQMNFWLIDLGGIGTNRLLLVFNKGCLSQMYRYRRIWVP